MRKPTQIQIDDMSSALINWFQSQDIEPRTALIVMGNLIASDLIVVSDGDHEKLDKGYLLYGEMLSTMLMNKLRLYHKLKQ